MTTSEPYSNNSILSSPSDKRRYKFLNLNNGLKCVLIQDPEMSHKEDDVTGSECFSSSLCTQDEQHYSREESDVGRVMIYHSAEILGLNMFGFYAERKLR